MPNTNYLIQGTTLSGIADAIRSKSGGSDPIAVEDFADDIGDIQTGHITTIDGVEAQTDLAFITGKTNVCQEIGATFTGDLAGYTLNEDAVGRGCYYKGIPLFPLLYQKTVTGGTNYVAVIVSPVIDGYKYRAVMIAEAAASIPMKALNMQLAEVKGSLMLMCIEASQNGSAGTNISDIYDITEEKALTSYNTVSINDEDNTVINQGINGFYNINGETVIISITGAQALSLYTVKSYSDGNIICFTAAFSETVYDLDNYSIKDLALTTKYGKDIYFVNIPCVGVAQIISSTFSRYNVIHILANDGVFAIEIDYNSSAPNPDGNVLSFSLIAESSLSGTDLYTGSAASSATIAVPFIQTEELPASCGFFRHNILDRYDETHEGIYLAWSVGTFSEYASPATIALNPKGAEVLSGHNILASCEDMILYEGDSNTDPMMAYNVFGDQQVDKFGVNTDKNITAYLEV